MKGDSLEKGGSREVKEKIYIPGVARWNTKKYAPVGVRIELDSLVAVVRNEN